MKLTQEYDGTSMAAGDTDMAAFLDVTSAGLLISPCRQVSVGAQVDGVCPRCHRWHTVGLYHGVPFCIWLEKESCRRVAAKGGVQ